MKVFNSSFLFLLLSSFSSAAATKEESSLRRRLGHHGDDNLSSGTSSLGIALQDILEQKEQQQQQSSELLSVGVDAKKQEAEQLEQQDAVAVVDEHSTSDGNWIDFNGPTTITCNNGRCNVNEGCQIWVGTYSIGGRYLPGLEGDYVLPSTCQASCEGCQQVPGSSTDGHGCRSSAGYVYCDILDACIQPWETPCQTDPCNSGSTGLVFCPERGQCIASWESSCGPTQPSTTTTLSNNKNAQEQQQQQHAAVNNDNEDIAENDLSLTTTDHDRPVINRGADNNNNGNVLEALRAYFDALQVVLGYEAPPSDPSEFQQMMGPLVKEVQWALGVMHPGIEKSSVTDEVIMKYLHVVGENNNNKDSKEKKNMDDDTTKKLTGDSDQCLDQTNKILAISMRCAYYGLYGDLNTDLQVQNAGKALANQLNAAKAREHLAEKLGPLRKEEEDYRLIAKEVFQFSEQELGLDGILQTGMKEWSMDNFWATGFFASEMWANAVQIGEFDTFPISSWTFYSPDTTFDDTLSNEFASLVDNYNAHCLTCPTGWTDHGLSSGGGYHCTAAWSPNCDEQCLQAECGAIKGSRWEAPTHDDLEYNPFACYLKACPQGWNNLGFDNDNSNPGFVAGDSMMCTMTRNSVCDETCAQVQCSNVGGTFPLSVDDVADNPYVCYV